MDCDYFDAGRCRSCALMHRPYADQLADKHAAAQATLSAYAGAEVWREPFASRESGFRNKAKLVVGGHPGEVTLGILDGHQGGVDLRECGLYETGLAQALPRLGELVDDLRLLPYDVRKARGELKQLLVTHSPDGELMVRFVLRSTRQLARIADALPDLPARVGAVAVASVNLQPEHKAILEGPEELVLSPTATLAMDLGEVRLHLRPNSFFQTNTAVARGLYRQARAWIDGINPSVVWDLYCGVGGFALYVAAPGRVVRGAEISADAIASARLSAADLGGAGDLDFATGDAARLPGELGWPTPDVVVLNPPRRGVESRLAAHLEQGGPAYVLYSSCNSASLARDLALMPSYRVQRAQVFDMFPQTTHSEVLVLLQR